jgi:hypothetical protein
MNEESGQQEFAYTCNSTYMRDVSTYPGEIAIKYFYPFSYGSFEERDAWIRGWDGARTSKEETKEETKES